MGHGGRREGSGRKTGDPKPLVVGVRFAPRDVDAIRAAARARKLRLSETVRVLVRESLGVASEPKGKKR